MGSNYYNKCGSCSHLNPNDRASGSYRYYCEERRAYYPLEDKVCSRYDYDKYRDYDELYRKDNPSGCYITTIMCDILHFPDNNETLNKLRTFRNEVLQKDAKYFRILIEYDTIGPLLAQNLKNDKDALRITRGLIATYIAPMLSHIDNKKYDEAVSVYTSMVNLLKDTYGIDSTIKQVEDYDMSIGGHGRVLKKERPINE